MAFQCPRLLNFPFQYGKPSKEKRQDMPTLAVKAGCLKSVRWPFYCVTVH